MSHDVPKRALIIGATVLALAVPSQAAPSTSRGLISAAQIYEMLEKSPDDQMARQVLTADLAGAGEAASAAAIGAEAL